MADITASVISWSATEASNQPTGDTTIGAGLDDNLRAIQSGVAKEHLKGSDIASAGTINPGASGSYGVYDVTGTTTITSLGTAPAGTKRTLRFTGALTLTHNGTSLILPNSSNITTVNGDVGEFVSLGSGNWYLKQYRPINSAWTSTTFSITASSSGNPTIDYTNSTSDAASSKVRFFKSRSGATTNSADVLGLVQYFGKDSSNVDRGAGYFQIQQTGSAGATFVPGQFILNLTSSAGSDTQVINATASSVNIPVSLTENSTRVFSRNSANLGSPPASQSWTATGVYTFAHGLSGVPDLTSVWLQCTTIDLGYAVGDRVYIQGASVGTAVSTRLPSVNVAADATNVYVIFNNTPYICNKSTAGNANITAGRWAVHIRAWY